MNVLQTIMDLESSSFVLQLCEKKKEKPFLTIKSPKNSIFPKRGLTHAFGPKKKNFLYLFSVKTRLVIVLFNDL